MQMIIIFAALVIMASADHFHHDNQAAANSDQSIYGNPRKDNENQVQPTNKGEWVKNPKTGYDVFVQSESSHQDNKHNTATYNTNDHYKDGDINPKKYLHSTGFEKTIQKKPEQPTQQPTEQTSETSEEIKKLTEQVKQLTQEIDEEIKTVGQKSEDSSWKQWKSESDLEFANKPLFSGDKWNNNNKDFFKNMKDLSSRNFFHKTNGDSTLSSNNFFKNMKDLSSRNFFPKTNGDSTLSSNNFFHNTNGDSTYPSNNFFQRTNGGSDFYTKSQDANSLSSGSDFYTKSQDANSLSSDKVFKKWTEWNSDNGVAGDNIGKDGFEQFKSNSGNLEKIKQWRQTDFKVTNQKKSVCSVGKPLEDDQGNKLFCGRGPNRVECPKSSTCIIDHTDRFAVCCADTAVAQDCESVFKSKLPEWSTMPCGTNGMQERKVVTEDCGTYSDSRICATAECVAMEWAEWSVTCGKNGMQERKRGSTVCGISTEFRSCPQKSETAAASETDAAAEKVDEESNGDGGNKAGVVAGIVIGTLVGVAILVVIVAIIVFKKKGQKADQF